MAAVNEMIERVAIAICKSRTCEGINCCNWPANRGRTKCPVKDGGYYDAAYAAIEAMRDPTSAMLEFGDAVRGNHADYEGGNGTANVYRAMIDTALAREGDRKT